MSATFSSGSGAGDKQAKQPRVRLEYLDGLRGLAALYVVLYHACLEVIWRRDGGGLPAPALKLCGLLEYGHYAVAVFIVLSGYCLMLPVARSEDRSLPGGFRSYIVRRARRILPPYYAALAFSLLIIVIVPEMGAISRCNWDWALPAFKPDVLLSHVFLYHNLNPAWQGKINPPMWSVATEWQIYFVFPALLVPVWRRAGLIAMVIAGFALGVGLNTLFYPHLEAAAPWYIGLFALGMAGAAIGFTRDKSGATPKRRIPWGVLSAFCWSVVVAIAIFKNAWMGRSLPMDSLVGLATVSMMLYCTQRLISGGDRPLPPVLRLFDSRPAVALGAYSYSLYLTHAPLLAVMSLILRLMGCSPLTILLTLLFVGVPVCVLAAYQFHLVFERRFMSSHPRPENASAKPAAAHAP